MRSAGRQPSSPPRRPARPWRWQARWPPWAAAQRGRAAWRHLSASAWAAGGLRTIRASEASHHTEKGNATRAMGTARCAEWIGVRGEGAGAGSRRTGNAPPTVSSSPKAPTEYPEVDRTPHHHGTARGIQRPGHRRSSVRNRGSTPANAMPARLDDLRFGIGGRKGQRAWRKSSEAAVQMRS